MLYFPALLQGSTDYGSDKIEMLFDTNARTMAEIGSCDQQLLNQEIAKMQTNKKLLVCITIITRLLSANAKHPSHTCVEGSSHAIIAFSLLYVSTGVDGTVAT